MRLRARLYPSTGYQEHDGPLETAPQMPIEVIEVFLRSDDGERNYTVGRLFFPTGTMDGFGPGIQLEVEDQRE